MIPMNIGRVWSKPASSIYCFFMLLFSSKMWNKNLNINSAMIEIFSNTSLIIWSTSSRSFCYIQILVYYDLAIPTSIMTNDVFFQLISCFSCDLCILYYSQHLVLHRFVKFGTDTLKKLISSFTFWSRFKLLLLTTKFILWVEQDLFLLAVVKHPSKSNSSQFSAWKFWLHNFYFCGIIWI